MRAQAWGRADVGRARKRNEDSFLVDDELGLFVVSDGMGGHRAGEVASATAVEAVARAVERQREAVERVRTGEDEVATLKELVDHAVQRACRAVFELALEDSSRTGMGCTLSLALVAGARAALGHVGDSRIYLVRGGAVHQLTGDHTFAQELADAGAIPQEAVDGHPYAHTLTRAVGTQDAVQCDLLVLDLVPGDRLLLCTDGLANYLEVEDDAWLAALLGAAEVAAAPDDLVRFANAAGGADNITAVVVAVEAEPEEPTEELAASSAEIEGALDACFLFADLGLDARARILQYGLQRDYEEAQAVLHQGTECPGLGLVVRGACAVEAEGRAPARLEPGDAYGVSALLDPRPARATVRAAGGARVLHLARDAFESLGRAHPSLGLNLWRKLARRVAAVDGAAAEDPA